VSTIAFLLAGWLAVFSGDCSSPQWSDPAGDQFNATPAPALDVVGVRVLFRPDTVRLELVLDPVTSTAADLLRLGGYLDIDADSSIDTGEPSHIDQFGYEPALPMGVDYYLSLSPGSDSVELYVVVPGFEVFLGFFPLTIDGTTIQIDLPRCGPDRCPGISLGARFQLALLIGNGDDWTDRAPNGEVPYEAVPARADFDEDGDIDRDDLAYFRTCISGPNIPQPDLACLRADLDGDHDVDQSDFGLYQTSLTGSCN
jgi:hypothetical protein